MSDGNAARQAVSSWLEAFDAALRDKDIEAATALFGEECYWRDLIAFTWNIKTVEGRDAIADMLRATLDSTEPSGWTLSGEPWEKNGAIEAWLDFETATTRGRGHLRLKDGKAFTLLTTPLELKGHEEKKGANRPKGVQHGVFKERKSWLERREEEARSSATTASLMS